MMDGKAHHGLDCFLADTGDLIPLLVVDEFLLHHPGAAAGHDLTKGQIVHHILGVDTTGGHPLQVLIGAGQRLDLLNTAVLLGREELDHFQSQSHSLLHFAAGGGAGQHQSALGQTILYDLGIKTGADDKVAACIQCPIQLLGGQHSTSAHQHLRNLSTNTVDSLLSSGSAEGHLGGGQSARYQCLGKRHCLLGILNGNDRNNANIEDVFQYVVHVPSLLIQFSAQSCS